MKVHVLVGFVACVLAGTCAAADQTAAVADQPVQPIGEVRFFPPAAAGEDSAQGPEQPVICGPVRIRGTVTWISRNGSETEYFVVQDDSAGIWVNVKLAGERGLWRGDAAVVNRIEPGMQVEIDGMQDLEGYAPLIMPQSVRIISESRDLPEPVAARMARLFNGCDACLRVEVDGILQGFRDGVVHGNARWILVLEADGHRFLATVPRDAFDPDPSHLVDGTLRVCGVAASRFTTRGEFIAPTIHLGHGEDVAVVAPPTTGAFDAPKLPLARISRFQRDPPSEHRVRTEGIVTYAQPGEIFYLQQGAVGVRVETQSSELLQPGDRVEVAGFIDRSRVVAGVSQAAGIAEAVVRRIGSGSPPVPLPIQPDEIVAINLTAQQDGLIARPGDYDGCLVSFTARLVEVRRAIAGGLLLLSSGKSTLSAAVPADAFEVLKTLEPGSELRVAGIAQVDLKPETGMRPIWHLPAVERMDVRVRSADDVTVLARPSWWTPRRLAAALAVTGGILAASLGWVWLLRRRVLATAARLAAEMRTRREAVVEFNATIRERNRLAANLHDTLLQTMSAIGMQLQSCELSGREGGRPAANHLGLARRMVDHAVGELRESVWALRSFPLKGQTFPEAIASLAAHLAEGQTTRISCRTTGPTANVTDFVAGNLLLVVQEAIHNALQHARAATIDVAVVADQDVDVIEVTVRDDGVGFVPGTQVGPLQGHFGLQGMRERVEKLGGTMRVESEPGRGTNIQARVRNLPEDVDVEAE